MLIKRKVLFGYKPSFKDAIRQVTNRKLWINVYNYKIECRKEIIVCVECSFIIYKVLNNIVPYLFVFYN